MLASPLQLAIWQVGVFVVIVVAGTEALPSLSKVQSGLALMARRHLDCLVAVFHGWEAIGVQGRLRAAARRQHIIVGPRLSSSRNRV